MSYDSSQHPSPVTATGTTAAGPTRPLQTRRLRRRVRTPMLLAAGVLAIAACGSVSASKSTPTTTPAPSVPATRAGASDTAPGAPASGTKGRAAIQAWETCLSQNGVTLPSPSTTVPGAISEPSPSATVVGRRGQNGGFGAGRGFGGGGAVTAVLSNPADAAAVTACKSLQPTFGGGGGGANPANRAAYQAYLSCLADNGVAVPTTASASGSTTSGAAPVSIDRSDPNFAAADAKCKVLLPARGPNGSTTTTTPTASTAGA